GMEPLRCTLRSDLLAMDFAVTEATASGELSAWRTRGRVPQPLWPGAFGAEILDEYVSMFRDPARVNGVCEEYRAAATIDVEHDQAEKEALKKIECPMLHLWSEGGPLDTFYVQDGGPLAIWRQWAPQAQGQPMKGGHFFPEENSEETVALIKRF